MASDFDPYLQNVTFLYRDGKTQINASVVDIDTRFIECISVSINYGAQIGACIVMFFVVLAMTPTSKLRRPSSVLHLLGLTVCAIRTGLLASFFTSKFLDFYAFFGNDYLDIPFRDFQASVAANVFSMLLAVVVEAALMNQAWTMVVLWPRVAKYAITAISIIITLLTISWRIAFCVVQSRAVWHLEPVHVTHAALIRTTIILNSFSICWFCALFNVKLIMHLIRHRGILATKGSLTPMEVLVMTNGVLMVIPVIFTGLEFGHFQNFEAASLTLTSVVLILPLGTVAARRMVRSNHLGYDSNISDSNGMNPGSTSGTGSGTGPHRGHQNRYRSVAPETATSTTPLKSAASFTSSRTASSPSAQFSSILSRCEAGGGDQGHHNNHAQRQQRPDHYDLELGEIEGEPMDSKRARVRVESAFEQREERV
ncbi:fungal pheromone mating factor STE2 GPCR domain-containing protein [Sarocladium implicatum]|nr:fungal pheromone mating factor STE2 GPCR domain-containing protein [Sarocladium implicatum]